MDKKIIIGLAWLVLAFLILFLTWMFVSSNIFVSSNYINPSRILIIVIGMTSWCAVATYSIALLCSCYEKTKLA